MHAIFERRGFCGGRSVDETQRKKKARNMHFPVRAEEVDAPKSTRFALEEPQLSPWGKVRSHLRGLPSKFSIFSFLGCLHRLISSLLAIARALTEAC